MARGTLRTLALIVLLTGTLGGLLIPGAARAVTPMDLNVKNVSALEVLKLIAESGDFDIVIGAGVKGSVTLTVNDMDPRDLLEVVVGVIDVAYVEERGAVWVMTHEAYERRYGEPFADSRISRTVVLQRAQVKDVMPTLTALLGEKAVLKPDLNGNVITIKGSPSLVREAVEMLTTLDRPTRTWSYPLHTIPPALAAGLLGKMLSEQATIVEDPVNRRLVVSSNEFELQRVTEMLEQIDAGDGVQPAVIDVGYADPDSLAAALRPHLTPDVGIVYCDRRAHRIVVHDHPTVLASVRQLATVFDVPQRQVLIEARILQVSTSDQIRSGIDWSVVQSKVNVRGYFPNLLATDPGLRGDFGDLTSQEYEVLVDALETYGKTDLLSSPRLMVVDGGSGHIHVGSQVPYTTIDTRETAAGTINQFEKVVIIDVGVKLEVAAQILGDDMVMLHVRPEVSSVTGFSDDIPIVDAATTDSSLLIENGNTVILGGLVKDEVRKVRKGIPLLSRIPLLKYLVSSTTDETLKSELVILLRPQIMTGREPYEAGR